MLLASSASSRLFPSRPRHARATGGWLPKHFAIRPRSSYGISRDGIWGIVPRGEREVPGTSKNSPCGGWAWESGTVTTYAGTGLYNPVPGDTRCSPGIAEYFLGTVLSIHRHGPLDVGEIVALDSQAALSKQAHGEILSLASTHRLNSSAVFWKEERKTLSTRGRCGHERKPWE